MPKASAEVLRFFGQLLWVALCVLVGLGSLGGRATPERRGSTFAHRSNVPVYLEYCRRMRTGFAFGLVSACQQSRDLLRKYKAGGYDRAPASFQCETKALSDFLLASVDALGSQQVPDVLYGSHLKILKGYRNCYESLAALHEAEQAEGPDRARLLKEAEAKQKEALSSGYAGIREFNQVWARTRAGS